jgi:putative ABC transport system substrate-binding protein
MSIDQTDAYRRSTIYINRILKVPKPAIFQFQQPTKFETAINLKTASVNLIVPPAPARSRRRGD